MCHAEVAADRGPDWHTHGALDQGCVGCHDPHASDYTMMVKQEQAKLTAELAYYEKKKKNPDDGS